MKLKYAPITLILLSGCASQPELYQKHGEEGHGYFDVELQENLYKISFESLNFSAAHTVSDLALLRAAELTDLKGFSHFYILDRKDNVATLKQTLQPEEITIEGHEREVDGMVRYGDDFFIEKPTTIIYVRMYKEYNGDPDMYDAKFLLGSMKRAYDID